MLDDTIRDLARGANFATLAFHLPSGGIASHVMWLDADDEHLLINTELHRAKYKAMAQDPRVTITVWDAANPYHYGEVRGEVVGEVRGADALANIHELSRKYTGSDYGAQVQSERVVLKVAPQRQRTQG